MSNYYDRQAKAWAECDYDTAWLCTLGFAKVGCNWVFTPYQIEVSAWNNWRVDGRSIPRPENRKQVIRLISDHQSRLAAKDRESVLGVAERMVS